MKTAQNHVASMILEIGVRAREDFCDLGKHWLGDCQSPIEIVLGTAMLVERIEGIDPATGLPSPVSSLIQGSVHSGTDYIGGLYRQTEIGPYRADFYLEAFDRDTRERWCRIIIECDGHDFHEKTKLQAAHDKKRDRWFQTEGIMVLRFAGSEIWADPLSCADQVGNTFHAMAQKYYAKRWGRKPEAAS